MAVSTDPDTSSALQSLYVGPLLKRFSRRIWKKTPKRTKILKLYFRKYVITSPQAEYNCQVRVNVNATRDKKTRVAG